MEVLIESKPILVLIIQVFFGDKGTKLELVPDLGRFIRIWLIWSLLYLIIMNILWRWRDRPVPVSRQNEINTIYKFINLNNDKMVTTVEITRRVKYIIDIEISEIFHKGFEYKNYS